MRIYNNNSPYLDVNFVKFISKMMNNCYDNFQAVEVHNDENVNLQDVANTLRRNKYCRIGYMQTDDSHIVVGLR